MRSRRDKSQPRLRHTILTSIDRYAGTCCTCKKDRALSETELVLDAEGDPHIVCSVCKGELTYIPF